MTLKENYNQEKANLMAKVSEKTKKIHDLEMRLADSISTADTDKTLLSNKLTFTEGQRD